MVHEYSESRRHLCNWHHAMVDSGDSQDVDKFEQQAYNRAKEATWLAKEEEKAVYMAKAAASTRAAATLAKATLAKKPRHSISPRTHNHTPVQRSSRIQKRKLDETNPSPAPDAPPHKAAAAATATGNNPKVHNVSLPKGNEQSKTIMESSTSETATGNKATTKATERPEPKSGEAEGYFQWDKEERDFFMSYGALVSASLSEHAKIVSGEKYHHYYSDGRPASLCRISGCFSQNGGVQKQYLCIGHYAMAEAALATKSATKSVTRT